MNELKMLQTEFVNLQSENRALDESAKTAEYLQTKIIEVKQERDKM